MADYDLLPDVIVGTKPKESKETEGAEVDHTSVAKAVEHGRADTLGKSGAMHLQRMAGNAAMGALVQRKAAGTAEEQQEQKSPVHDVIGKGGGSSLDAGVRTQMETSMGQDFSDVKVHTGSDAAHASKSVQAQAFTVGNEIVFNEGKYNPSSPEGQRTIAHELTHVVQQREGAVDGTPREGGISVSDPADKFEQEAESNADAVMAGGKGHEGHDHAAPASAAGVQREADDEGAADVQTMRDDTAVQREGDEEKDEAPEAEAEEEKDVQPLAEDTAVQREGDEEKDEAPEAEAEEEKDVQPLAEVQRDDDEKDEGESEE